jgi:hypothetical protein
MSYQNAVPAAAGGPEIVLRRLRSVLSCAVLAAVLIPLFFWIPMAHGTLKGMAGGGAIGALLGCILVARFGTAPAQRQRLLAALGPYVLADGVSRTGLATEALSGDLWWPRPRR